MHNTQDNTVMLTEAAVKQTLLQSFAFISVVSFLLTAFDLTDCDKYDEDNYFDDDADQRPDSSQTIYSNYQQVSSPSGRNIKIMIDR